MERLQMVKGQESVFWESFNSTKKCKARLIKLKTLGYKWFNGKEILPNEKLNFYFTLEINIKNKTIGFVPNFQRFRRKMVSKND